MDERELKIRFPRASRSFLDANRDISFDKEARVCDTDNVSDLDSNLLYNAYLQTKSVHKAGIQFSITGETVRRILHKSGYKLLRSGWSLEEDAELLQSTGKLFEIAKKMGRSKASVAARRSRLQRKEPVVNLGYRETRKCLECSIPITSFGIDDRKYCSTLCATRNETWKHNNRAAHPAKRDYGKTKCGTCDKEIMRNHKNPTQEFCSQSCAQSNPVVSKKRIMSTRANPRALKTSYANCKRGWRVIGNQRIYARSSWEANYARYLQFLKEAGEIIDWQHEPDTFWFEKIKRGSRSYLPDFKVTNPKDKIEYHEVKGYMTSKDRTKLKRMKKYYPTIKVVVIDSKAYRAIAKKIKHLIPAWETTRDKYT